MNRLLIFIRNHERPLVYAALAFAFVLLFFNLNPFDAWHSHSVSKQEQKLEAEKQQALKERDEARANDLILKGKLQAKDEQIQQLNSQIAESNQKVVNAHNETQTAKASYDKVRVSAPHFDSADDVGRVKELSTELRRLYSDPEK